MDPIITIIDSIDKTEYNFVAPHITKVGMIRKSKVRQRRNLFEIFYGGIADFDVIYSEDTDELTRMRAEVLDGVRLYYATLTGSAAVVTKAADIVAPKAEDIPIQK